MAFAFTGVKNGSSSNGGGTGISVTLTGVTAGSLVCVVIKWEGNASTSSVTDGTTPLTADTINSPQADLHTRFFYILTANGGDKTYTVTWGESMTFRRIIAIEATYTGTAAFETSNRAGGTGTALNSGNITTTGSDLVAFGAYGEYSSETVGSNLINGQAADTIQVATGAESEMWGKIFSAGFTGAATATLTGSANWAGSVIAFEATGGGGGTTIPILMHNYRRRRVL